MGKKGRPKKQVINGRIICNKCNLAKPLSMFSKEGRAKSGYQASCKICQSLYYSKNRDRYQELKKGNVGYLQKMREYFLYNKNVINQYKRSRYKTNEGKLMVLSNNYKRRERTRETSDGTVTAKALLNQLRKQNYKCAITGGHLNQYHIDHIIPLNKGGKHTINNIQFVLPEVNMSKKDNLEYATK